MTIEDMLRTYDDDELRAELERRERRRLALPRAKADNDINWSNLLECLNEGLEHLERNGYHGKDFEHYVFECAIETVYGRDVWKWWNERLDS